MSEERQNDDGKRAVHLDEDVLAFAVDNCDANINCVLFAMDQLNARGALSRELADKQIKFLEMFKRLKTALEEAR